MHLWREYWRALVPAFTNQSASNTRNACTLDTRRGSCRCCVQGRRNFPDGENALWRSTTRTAVRRGGIPVTGCSVIGWVERTAVSRGKRGKKTAHVCKHESQNSEGARARWAKVRAARRVPDATDRFISPSSYCLARYLSCGVPSAGTP